MRYNAINVSQNKVIEMSSRSQSGEKEFISFRFRKGLKQKLAQLSAVTGRSQTFLAQEALEAYCDLQAWQIEMIDEGIRDADNGNLLSSEEVLAELEALRGPSL